MPALKEKPKLNRWDVNIRQLAASVSAVELGQGDLRTLVIKRLLVFPDLPQNLNQVAYELRRNKNQCATDYNVKKTLRFLTEHGVVESYHGNMFKLSQDMRVLISEASSKNVKDRQKRKGL